MSPDARQCGYLPIFGMKISDARSDIVRILNVHDYVHPCVCVCMSECVKSDL